MFTINGGSMSIIPITHIHHDVKCPNDHDLHHAFERNYNYDYTYT